MFTSRLLNSLTRTHPVVPLVLYGPVICALAVLGMRLAGLLPSVGLMVAGYLTWTLSEYWVHRAVFHFQPRGPRSESFVWTIHGMHHAYPNDPRRVVTARWRAFPARRRETGKVIRVLRPRLMRSLRG
jgi:dihydroceramide fatty acyl 2-hydroxylase